MGGRGRAVLEAPSPFGGPPQPSADGGRGPLDSSAGEISGVPPLPCRGLPSSSHPWDAPLAPCGRNPWDPPLARHNAPRLCTGAEPQDPLLAPCSHPPTLQTLSEGYPWMQPPPQPCRGDARTHREGWIRDTGPPPAPGPPPWPCTRLWAAAVVLSHPRCHPHVSPRVMLQAWVSELSQPGGS